MVICLVGIGGIVDNHCLSFLFIKVIVLFSGVVPKVKNLPH